MKLATWNVNSIKARKERVLEWIDRTKPDVLCLQELKLADEFFPREEFESRGYQIALHGQKTYNGVAIVSRSPLVEVAMGIGDGDEDPQARLITATTQGIRVLSVYAPNGQTVGSEKWEYKLRWLERLRRRLAEQIDSQKPLVLCGDFNVAPEERDVCDPAFWERTVLFHPEARAALGRLCSLGLRDTYRLRHEEAGRYTWWDYRQLAFPKNQGLRIDHILATAPVAERITAAEIDREARKGKLPSDHAPVVVEIAP